MSLSDYVPVQTSLQSSAGAINNSINSKLLVIHKPEFEPVNTVMDGWWRDVLSQGLTDL